MEGSASAPTHPLIELEPPEWQPRALRAQDPNKDWKIGHVKPSLALGLIILLVLVASALAMRIAATRPELTVSAGAAALVLALLSVLLQVIDWTTLGFGPESGGYASVFVGWTAFYSVITVLCAFWIQTQVATSWRRRRQGAVATPAQVMSDTPVVEAGLEACSFFWSFYVANGLVLFVLLYLL